MKLRVGIVGCGKFADIHIQQVHVLDNAEVVAVCDLEPLMARQMAVRYSLPAMYSDLGRMLTEQRLDVVHITTPPASHPALASIAMEAGCHVFVEKPLALNLKAAQEIVAAAEHHGRKLCINYWYNYDPPGEALRRLVEEGVLGAPVHVESVFGYDLSGVFGSAVLGDNEHWVHHLPGKLFHNVLDHVVNKIALFMPDADPQICAFDHRHRPASGDAVTDTVMDELRFLMQGERVSGYGLISSHARPAGQTLRVYGTRNTIQVDFQKRTVVVEISTDRTDRAGAAPRRVFTCPRLSALRVWEPAPIPVGRVSCLRRHAAAAAELLRLHPPRYRAADPARGDAAGERAHGHPDR